MTDEAYDCQACGACCVSWDAVPDYVTIETRDYNRMSARARKHVHKVRSEGANLRVMKLGYLPVLDDAEVLACTALEGCVARKVSCTIYDERPKPCVRMEPGSDYCKHVRGIVGLDT